MKVIKDYYDCPDLYKHQTVAIGNFDGMHLGHKTVINSAKDVASKTGTGLGVLTFEPHPVTVLRHNASMFVLTELERKLELLESMKVDVVYVVDFSKEFASLTADQFVDDILVGAINVSNVLTGYDFIFGKGRLGNTDMLVRRSKECNFFYAKVEKQEQDGIAYSSTQIRRFLSQGKVKDANAFLGYPYQLSGMVVRGKQLGRTLGFPTANIRISDHTKMKNGVYHVRAITETNQMFNAIANLGLRPTVEQSDQLQLEVHIPDFEGDLYDRYLRVEFLDFIRAEEAFSGLDALKAQIKKDIEYVRAKGNV